MKKVYQLLAISLCLATPSFSSDRLSFSIANFDDEVFSSHVMHPINKALGDLENNLNLGPKPFRDIAKLFAECPEVTELCQELCTAVNSVDNPSSLIKEKVEELKKLFTART